MPLYYTDQLAEGQEAVFVPLERRLGEARSARMPSRRIFTRWRPNGANNAGMDSVFVGHYSHRGTSFSSLFFFFFELQGVI